MSALGFCLLEAARNVGKNVGLAVASVSTATVSLLVLGIFMLLSFNVTHFGQVISDQVGIHAFLNQGTTTEQSTALMAQIKALPHVKSVTYISPDQALHQLEADFGTQGSLFAGIGSANPLLPALQIQATQAKYVQGVAQAVQKLPNVASVHYEANVVQRLVNLFNGVRIIGLVLGVLLAAGTLLVIGNAIRTGIYARRREIQIMRLVGATEALVRWPFILEGLVLGLVGGALAFGIIDVGYRSAVHALGQTLPFLPLVPLSGIAGQLAIALVGAGVILGFAGSGFSFRKVRL